MECGESGDQQGKGNDESANKQSAITDVRAETGTFTSMYVVCDVYVHIYVTYIRIYIMYIHTYVGVWHKFLMQEQ